MIDPCEADYCPCCGQPRELNGPVERYGIELRGYMLCYGAKRIRMRPKVAKLLRLLLTTGRSSHARLRLNISPDSDSNSVNVYATYLRRHLSEATGGAVRLNTIHSWGYELLEATEQRKAA